MGQKSAYCMHRLETRYSLLLNSRFIMTLVKNMKFPEPLIPPSIHLKASMLSCRAKRLETSKQDPSQFSTTGHSYLRNRILYFFFFLSLLLLFVFFFLKMNFKNEQ